MYSKEYLRQFTEAMARIKNPGAEHTERSASETTLHNEISLKVPKVELEHGVDQKNHTSEETEFV